MVMGTQFGANDLIRYLVSKGLSRNQAAGIAGNVETESSFDPAAFNKTESAYGLFQHRGTRYTAGLAHAGGVDAWANPYAQMDFALSEAGTSDGGNVMSIFRANPNMTAEEAARIWDTKFEKSSGASLSARQAQAARYAANDPGDIATLAAQAGIDPTVYASLMREASAPGADELAARGPRPEAAVPSPDGTLIDYRTTPEIAAGAGLGSPMASLMGAPPEPRGGARATVDTLMGPYSTDRAAADKAVIRARRDREARAAVAAVGPVDGASVVARGAPAESDSTLFGRIFGGDASDDDKLRMNRYQTALEGFGNAVGVFGGGANRSREILAGGTRRRQSMMDARSAAALTAKKDAILKAKLAESLRQYEAGVITAEEKVRRDAEIRKEDLALAAEGLKYDRRRDTAGDELTAEGLKYDRGRDIAGDELTAEGLKYDRGRDTAGDKLADTALDLTAATLKEKLRLEDNIRNAKTTADQATAKEKLRQWEIDRARKDKPIDLLANRLRIADALEDAAATESDPEKAARMLQNADDLRKTLTPAGTDIDVNVGLGGETQAMRDMNADYNELRQKSRNALVEIQAYDNVIRQLAEHDPSTGPLWKLVDPLIGIMNDLGIEVGDLTEDYIARQGINGIVSRLIAKQREIGSGSTSDYEMEIFARGVPTADKPREALNYILSFNKRLAQQARAKAKFMRRARIAASRGGDTAIYYEAEEEWDRMLDEGHIDTAPLSYNLEKNTTANVAAAIKNNKINKYRPLVVPANNGIEGAMLYITNKRDATIYLGEYARRKRDVLEASPAGEKKGF